MQVVYILLLLNFILCFCTGDNTHEKSAESEKEKFKNSGECQWVSLPICQQVARSWANFPNLLGHRNQIEIANSSAYKYLENLTRRMYASKSIGNSLDAGIDHQTELLERCTLQIYQVSCAFLVPKCVYVDRIQVSSLPPCKSTCMEVRERCESILHSEEMEWPEFLDCESWVQCHLPTVCRHSDAVLAPHSRSGTVQLPIQLVTRRRKIPRVEFKHHSELAARKVMTRLTRQCPGIMRLYTIGRSVKNKPLYVMEISDNAGMHEALEPEVKYIGAIHGNEVLGRELLLQLMQHICREWLLGNERIRNIVRNTRIHLLPTMNPDGYSVAARQGPERNGWLTGRFNSRDHDLNRHFPDLTKIAYINEAKFARNHHLEIPKRYWREHKKGSFPEIYAVIKWLENYDFTLSAQLHGGELVANYPYDVRRKTSSYALKNFSPELMYSKSPDDKVFRHLASTYAENHGTMADPVLNRCEEKFGRRGGITNGAAWYTISGGMQDFNYLYTNSFEILIELSCRKFLPAKELPREWINNKEALLKYIEQAHIGIKGYVTDEFGIPFHRAVIHVHGIRHDVTTNEKGEYWRMLLPGKYIVTAVKDELTDTKWVHVTNNDTTASRYDFVLKQLPGRQRPNKQDIDELDIHETEHQNQTTDKNVVQANFDEEPAKIAEPKSSINKNSFSEVRTTDQAQTTTFDFSTSTVPSIFTTGIEEEVSTQMTEINETVVDAGIRIMTNLVENILSIATGVRNTTIINDTNTTSQGVNTSSFEIDVTTESPNATYFGSGDGDETMIDKTNALEDTTAKIRHVKESNMQTNVIIYEITFDQSNSEDSDTDIMSSMTSDLNFSNATAIAQNSSFDSIQFDGSGDEENATYIESHSMKTNTTSENVHNGKAELHEGAKLSIFKEESSTSLDSANVPKISTKTHQKSEQEASKLAEVHVEAKWSTIKEESSISHDSANVPKISTKTHQKSEQETSISLSGKTLNKEKFTSNRKLNNER
uniref:carboxypeptidase Z-like n=1 Tax=Styela clava TaxID=7725 RepID=UPI0019394943|nr:carboxypeptidase Z-like [Styela clava]